jgi:pyruvate dehydrogenase E1 component alpha subunit
MNVLTVFDEVSGAVERARNEGLPTFLEIKTYRYKGHSMSDPGKYRTREELEEHKKQDPVLILKDMMMPGGLLTGDEFKAMDGECLETASRAAEFAERSPEPAPEALYQDIWA